MLFKFLKTKRIDRFMALQNDIESYYKKMAFITTEEDLKIVLTTLSEQHATSRKELENILYPKQNKIEYSLKKSKSYLGKMWKKVLSALLVNNRLMLREFARQTEVKLLQEVQLVIEECSENDELVATLQEYEHRVKSYLKTINKITQRFVEDYEEVFSLTQTK